MILAHDHANALSDGRRTIGLNVTRDPICAEARLLQAESDQEGVEDVVFDA
jgi:hypothetical protein